MNHICLGKDRAPACDPDRVIGLEREIPESLDGDPEPGSLLI
jgi:hypothetical protein